MAILRRASRLKECALSDIRAANNGDGTFRHGLMRARAGTSGRRGRPPALADTLDNVAEADTAVKRPAR
jgi:hypothetical protein